MLYLVRHLGESRLEYDREHQIRLMRARFEETHDQFLLMVDRVVAFTHVLLDLHNDFERLVKEEPIVAPVDGPECSILKFPGPKAS